MVNGRTCENLVDVLVSQLSPSLREDVRRSFEASPFFSAWDPSVLDVYLECGFTRINEDSDVVRLKMPGLQVSGIRITEF